MILLIDIKGINIVLSLLVRILVHYGKLLMQFFFNVLAPFVLKIVILFLPSGKYYHGLMSFYLFDVSQ